MMLCIYVLAKTRIGNSMQKVMSEQSTIFHNREVNYNRLHCYSKVFTAQSHNQVHFKTCLSCGVSLLTRTHTLYKENYVSLCLSFTVIHTYAYTYLVHNEHTRLPTCTCTHTHTHKRTHFCHAKTSTPMNILYKDYICRFNPMHWIGTE